MNYIGIDPGKNGAVARLDDAGGVLSLVDMPSTPRDLFEHLSTPVRGLVEIRVAVEKQQPMPRQGVSSTFQTGFGFGCIVGVLTATGLPYELITATAWKRAMGLTSDKEQSRAAAQRLFPSAELHRKRDEGRAEALLLAEYLRRRERGT